MTKMLTNAALCAVLLVVGCVSDDAAAPKSDGVAYLTPTQHLVRASMAIRGTRPGLSELRQVGENPALLPQVVDYYLDSAEFGATVREMHAEQLLIDVDAAFYPAGFPAVGPLADMDVQEINERVAEAPTRLVEHVVTNDHAYHEIVTADYTVVDGVTSAVFGVPYDPAGDEWQVSRYEDGREHAGLLSDSFIFTRHSSTFSNRNRGRAAFVARSFLCYDFLDREVEIDATIDLADEDAVMNAIRENAACVSCHQTLDPLAAYFAEYTPIYVPSFLETYPFDFYRNPLRGLMRVTDPGYFGEPSTDIYDLGVLIASDPRFGLCTARRFYSYMAQVPQSEVPLEIVAGFNDRFLASGMNAKQLVRAIVLSDEFRVSHATMDEGADEVRGLRKARPTQLARMFEDLTGFRWQTDLPVDFGIGQIGRIDLMTDSFFGYDVLAGGTDGQSVTRPSHTMNPTATLVLRALAAHAAPYAVTADFAESDTTYRWLLRRVEDTTTDEPAIRAQLVDLNLRFYGEDVAADDPSIDDAWTLWSQVAAEPDSSPRRAWTVTLYAMLQDVRIVHY